MKTLSIHPIGTIKLHFDYEKIGGIIRTCFSKEVREVKEDLALIATVFMTTALFITAFIRIGYCNEIAARAEEIIFYGKYYALFVF